MSDGRETRLIVMEYVRYGSLSQFVNKQYKTLGTEQRLHLFKKFALDIAEV